MLLRVHGYVLYPIQHQIYHTRLSLDQTQTNPFRFDDDWLKIALHAPPIARMSLKLSKILLAGSLMSRQNYILSLVKEVLKGIQLIKITFKMLENEISYGKSRNQNLPPRRQEEKPGNSTSICTLSSKWDRVEGQNDLRHRCLDHTSTIVICQTP